MASFSLIGPPQFPNGTSVAAYPVSNWGGRVITTAAPVGSATETKSVSGGVAAFTALAANTRYVAYALVSSEHRYKRFSTLSTPGTAVSTYADWTAASQPDGSVVVLSQAEYDGLSSPSGSVLFVISG